MPVGEPRRHQRSRLLANILKACHPDGRICVRWLPRMNAIDPTVSQDGLTWTSAAQHAASSIRTGASGLPSAAEIWATGAEASAQITEEASARPGKITEKVVLRPEPAMAAEPDSIRQNSIRQNSVGKSSVRVQAGLAEGRPWPPRRLSLALQGGGSFGAFTWGVLDRLLEEPNCDLDTISRPTAAAVNGLLLPA